MACDGFNRVYFTPSMASLVASFQCGHYQDMLPLRYLQIPPHLTRDVYPREAYAGLATALNPWLVEHGLTRLPRLFACLEDIHAIMLLHGAYMGRVDVVEVALNVCGVSPAMTMLMIDLASWNNQRLILDFFQQHPHATGWKCSSFALVAAARNGHTDIVQFLHGQFPSVPSTEDAMDMAAEGGHLEIVKFLHAHRSEGCSTRAMNGAARNGHLNLLRFLHANRSEGCTELAMDLACEHGHLDVARWLHEHRSWEGFTECAFDKAAGNNHMAVVEFLHFELDAPSTEKAMDLAAENGHLGMVQWLHEHRSSQGCSERALGMAAAKGHLDVVKWLHANRSESGSPSGFAGGAAAGGLEMMEWLMAHCPDCDLYKGAMGKASKDGLLEVVQWLLSHGQEVTEAAVDDACLGGHMDVIKCLFQHRPSAFTSGAFQSAIEGGHLELVKWLYYDLGITHRDAMEGAATYGHFNVLKWLHELNSFTATTYVMDEAASYGHLQIVQWLHSHRHEGCTSAAMDGAAANGHFSVVKWLHRYRTEGCTIDAMNFTAAMGDLTMVEFLHTHRTEGCTSHAMDCAAANGHLTAVMFLHAHRSEGGTNYGFECAVMEGSLGVAKWLHTIQGRAVSRGTLMFAARNGDLAAMRWALLHSSEDISGVPFADYAIDEGRLSMVHLLLDMGCTWTMGAMDRTAERGHLAILIKLQGHWMYRYVKAMQNLIAMYLEAVEAAGDLGDAEPPPSKRQCL
ncbi:hypothetical protein DYB25_001009 [Aphanomyces astaci]|uniref:Uncharacterized protein n=1 Tax=Aphanomyces astaci TaxID=112090 RepID=A0A397BCZ2_APHAT|nr:hypothetical protein DYB25_001009 [Aphanomyces astaci]